MTEIVRRGAADRLAPRLAMVCAGRWSRCPSSAKDAMSLATLEMVEREREQVSGGYSTIYRNILGLLGMETRVFGR